MTQPTGQNDRHETPADEAELSARLQRLGERLGHQQPGRVSENETGQGTRSDPSGLARGFRLASEFVAGVLIGAAIGWLIDRFAGTSPWGMIVFLLLGFAAGVLNVTRAAGEIAKNSLRPPDQTP
jgi:ATP synthase protein I